MRKIENEFQIECCLTELIMLKNTLLDVARLMAMEGTDYNAVQFLSGQLDDHLKEMAELLFPGEYGQEFGPRLARQPVFRPKAKGTL